MDKETIDSLNRRLLEKLESGTTDCGQQEFSVTAEAFCSVSQLQKEKQAIFLDTPQPIAFAAEIAANGSYLALQVLDTPVLLTRNNAGILQAFVNSCRHRGAQVASGSSQGKRLVCPFHGWTYDLNGELVGRPGDDYFDTAKENSALAPLPVSEKYGLVVIGLHPAVTQSSVDSALEEFGPALSHLNLSNYRALERREMAVAANWKLINDLSLESYHFSTLHRDSVAQLLASNAIVDTYQRSSRWAFPLKSIGDLAHLPASDWPDEVQGSVTYTAFPGVMFIINALGAQMIRTEPGETPGRSRVIYAGVARPDRDVDAARKAYEFGGEVFANEDLPMAEQCQQGIAATGSELLMGRNESLLHFWHQLWQKMVDSC